ncbi:MAG: DNA (cytosine-5-)-methyltransferase, partial [Longicatena sp.]
MYQEYRRMLVLLKPKMFIFENVLGLLSMRNDKGNPVINDIYSMFSDIDNEVGYTIQKKVLNAKDYGVPQSRERVFLVGIRSDIQMNWKFPTKTIRRDNYLTVSDAISDLPHLDMEQQSNVYALQPQNEYQILMRQGCTNLTEHFNGEYGDKMQAIMEAVPEGEGKDYINRLVDNGTLAEEYRLTSGYKNTYGRLWWNRPCTTITNNLGRPSSLRCIHPIDNRALTTREGARLQSFPDICEFFGSKYDKNSQVGNAVPPLLAMNISKEVTRSFEEYLQGDENHE